MKKYLFIILLSTLNICYSQNNLQHHFFSDPIDLDSIKCTTLSKVELQQFQKKIEIEIDTFLLKNGKYRTYELIPINIDQDSDCELLHIYKNTIFGSFSCSDIYDINEKDSLYIIGRFTGGITFAKSKENYLHLLSGYCAGHKTNCIWHKTEYRYKNGKYQLYENPKMTRGQYASLGLKAYRSKQYQLAKKYYKNALLLTGGKRNEKLKCINDIVVTMMKLKEFAEARALLLQTLEKYAGKPFNHKVLSAAKFNLGVISEYQNNYEDALRYFQAAYELNSVIGTCEKIELLKAKIYSQ